MSSQAVRNISIFLVSLLFILPLAESSSADLPLEHFVRKSDYLDLKISPDGRHYAARIRDDEKVYLLIVSLDDGSVVGGVSPGEDNEVSSILWVSDKRIIYTFSEKGRSRDYAGFTGELFAVNIDSSQNKLLAGYRADDQEIGRRIKYQKSSLATHRVISTLPAEKRKVLIIEYPWSLVGHVYYDDRQRLPIVSKLDIFTGKKTNKEVIPFRDASVYANDAGEINFITWRDETSMRHASYRQNKKDKWVDISEAFGDKLQKLVVAEISRDGKKIFMEGSYTDREPKTLFRFDLDSKELSKLFENKVDLYGWEVDSNNEPVVGISFPAEIEYHYSVDSKDSEATKVHKSLVNAFSGKQVWLSSQSVDGSKLTLRAYSSTNPGEYYSYDTNTKKADFLWANYSWIDPRAMLPKKSFRLKARDGQVLHGYITMPRLSENDSKPPLVVLPHGGPHQARDYPFFDSEAQLLANRGYAVLQVNFRGSSGYNEEFEKAGYTQWGGLMIDDIIDSTVWAVDEGLVAEDRICIYGASYGGYAALMSAVKAPDLFKCTIGYVGVYDLEAMSEKGDIPRNFGGLGYLKKVLGNDIEALRQYSPINLADKIKAKVLLIHGDEDVRVPSYHAKKMRAELRKVGKEAEWLYLGNVAHGAVSLENRMKVYTKLLSFLDSNIGH